MIYNYKGYQGEATIRDDKVFIRILHIDDFISTECDNASQAKGEFHALVDEYIETCQEIGKEPNKPFKGSFNVRVPPEVHKQIAMAAAKESLTLNAWISNAIQEKLSVEESKVHYASLAVRVLTDHWIPSNWVARTMNPGIFDNTQARELKQRAVLVLSQESVDFERSAFQKHTH